MKNYVFALGIILATFGMSAQTKNNRLGVAVGGGSQKYKGDLGNGFKFKNDVWTGGVTITAGYYLTKSFDIGLFGFKGDFGFCQPDEAATKEVDAEHRCPGCIGRTTLGNLNSHMTSGGLSLKYKLNNNTILKENALIRPYVYVGMAINNIQDKMKMKCVQPGNYFSVNGGLGAKCYLNERINVGYNLAFGYFTNDYLDFMPHGGSDMYMQNTISLGIDLF